MTHDTGLSRRSFLKLMSLSAGAVAAGPAMTLANTATLKHFTGTNLKALQVDVLLPQTGQYPVLNKAFTNGFQLFFRQAAQTASVNHNTHVLKTHGIDAGANSPHAVAKRALNGGADVVVGVLNDSVASALNPLFAERQRTLIVANAGENMPRTLNQQSNVFYHTLNYWQSSWAAGQVAAAQFGKRAVVIGALKESGYDAFHAFKYGFESAGGTVTDQHITHLTPQFDGLDAAFNALHHSTPDVIYAAYYGEESAAFTAAYRRSGLRVPLIASSFMETAESAAQVRAWAAALETSSAFSRSYSKYYGTQPTAFSLLGYETAALVALSAAGHSPTNEYNSEVLSPRGEIILNRHHTSAPLYLNAAGQISRLSAIAEQDVYLLNEQTTVKSGWTNPYLSI